LTPARRDSVIIALASASFWRVDGTSSLGCPRDSIPGEDCRRCFAELTDAGFHRPLQRLLLRIAAAHHRKVVESQTKKCFVAYSFNVLLEEDCERFHRGALLLAVAALRHRLVSPHIWFMVAHPKNPSSSISQSTVSPSCRTVSPAAFRLDLPLGPRFRPGMKEIRGARTQWPDPGSSPQATSAGISGWILGHPQLDDLLGGDFGKDHRVPLMPRLSFGAFLKSCIDPRYRWVVRMLS
jgi:hypothetical protein